MMFNFLLKRFVGSSLTCSYHSFLPNLMQSQLPRMKLKQLYFLILGRRLSYGINLALAAKGIHVKDKVFYNLNSSELQQHGANAIITESLSGLPLHIRGNVLEETSTISRTQFNKLLKQVTSHISSIPNVFVHDGTIGSSPKCDAKVRVISENPTAALSLSNVLWKTSSRAVSHDSCPLTVFVATSIGPGVAESIGLGPQGSNGFIVGDVEHSLLVLCGKAFSDKDGTKEALAALSGPIISARGGLPLSARLLGLGNSVVLLFAPENIGKSCADKLVSADVGVVLSSQGVATLFRDGSSGGSNLFEAPVANILASSDSTGSIPYISKLSPGQAAYHFLAGYQNGKFLPAYCKGPSSVDPPDLAIALLSKLKDNQIPSYLVNVGVGEESLTGKDFFKLVESCLSKNIPPLQTKASDLQQKYKSFLSGKFQELPEELSF
ncbi:uncharacterized protein LOC133834215 isoform X2 [Humulus lupulus]|uniref:uncharacterized protein LOC133834215 isoform X2 n=1 Tax=Humulus lupulus TaxID=3486 RepID=UPI002B411FF9|nr:uncharacterized protein LOC133834215 isoform X2 [Humulus lupulus]